ncbi:MAG: hypothetical protein KA785_04830 [Spirochaetaceae bacterium]|jgi:hypothetical protein|nr:hypothetical protein [Spirochaetaceae bacterium]
MAVSKKKNLGVIVLQLALALFLVFSGIKALQITYSSDASLGTKISATINRAAAGYTGNELVSAVDQLVESKDAATIIIVILAICELIAGAFLAINFFIDTGKFTDIILLIIMALWIVVLVLVDIMGKGGLLNGAFNDLGAFLAFSRSLSSHLLVLGALLIVSKR